MSKIQREKWCQSLEYPLAENYNENEKIKPTMNLLKSYLCKHLLCAMRLFGSQSNIFYIRPSLSRFLKFKRSFSGTLTTKLIRNFLLNDKQRNNVTVFLLVKVISKNGKPVFNSFYYNTLVGFKHKYAHSVTWTEFVIRKNSELIVNNKQIPQTTPLCASFRKEWLSCEL